MKRSFPPGFGTPLRRGITALSAFALLALAAASHTGCMGGTTGVDNPGLAELRVDFRDAAGNPAAVLGTLEVYEHEHNPAVATEPLLRVEVANSAGVKLTREQFDRIGTALAPKHAGMNFKRSALGAQGVAPAALADAARGAATPDGSDGLIRFNLVFRSGSGSGAIATGLSYDPAGKVFRLDANPAATGVRLLPRALIRFAARIRPGAMAGDLGRVFLPGTPFQAAVVDSAFALQNLPEGRFGVRLLGDKGYVYAVRESLDTRLGQSFTAEPDPIGRVDTAIAPAGFGVGAGGLLYANPQEKTLLQGKLLGADANDSRLAILWRLLSSSSSDTASIGDPTRLDAQIVFPTSGNYALELSATLGATTVRDTAQYKVGPAVNPGPAAKLIAPQPGDSLKQGQAYKVTWDAPVAGLARLEYNYKGGAEPSWMPAADSVPVVPGSNVSIWTPPVVGTIEACLLRLRMLPGDSLLTQTSAPFFLVP